MAPLTSRFQQELKASTDQQSVKAGQNVPESPPQKDKVNKVKLSSFSDRNATGSVSDAPGPNGRRVQMLKEEGEHTAED